MNPSLYARVSTDDQSVENQLLALHETLVRQGKLEPHQVLCVYADHGYSGRLGRERRPAYNQLLRDVAAGGVKFLLAWSIDRVGRSVRETIAFLEELHRHGCKIYLHQQQMDTSTPYGAAMLQMAMVFAELESKVIGARIREGYRRCREEGRKIGRFENLTAEQRAAVRGLLAQKPKLTIRKVAELSGVSKSAVQRLKQGVSRG